MGETYARLSYGVTYRKSDWDDGWLSVLSRHALQDVSHGRDDGWIVVAVVPPRRESHVVNDLDEPRVIGALDVGADWASRLEAFRHEIGKSPTSGPAWFLTVAPDY